MKLADQFQLLSHRGHVTHAGDIGSRLFITLDKSCSFRVSDSCQNDGDLICRIGRCLGSRCSYGNDKIHLIIDELGGDRA